jgi:hypothetical protein
MGRGHAPRCLRPCGRFYSPLDACDSALPYARGYNILLCFVVHGGPFRRFQSIRRQNPRFFTLICNRFQGRQNDAYS